METCKSCKWWDHDNSLNDAFQKSCLKMNALKRGFQGAVETDRFFGNLDNLGIDIEKETRVTGSGLVVITGPEFGCIHHKKK